MKVLRELSGIFLIVAAGLLIGETAQAGAFEVAVSPSRFEVGGASGQRIGQSIDIHNVGTTATEVSLRTLDWRYSEDGNITYYDELLPDSCRQWVTLERNTVSLRPKSKNAFRFQVDVPADAARSECRFMLAVEGVEPAHKPLIQSGGASLSLPVNGRIAIAVYVTVNGAEPRLEMKQAGVATVNGKRTPVVQVSNQGDAHGRLEGSLEAVDASGRELELVPEGTPVMPGQTRYLPLTAKPVGSQDVVDTQFPLRSKGTLDWEKGSFKVDAEFR